MSLSLTLRRIPKPLTALASIAALGLSLSLGFLPLTAAAAPLHHPVGPQFYTSICACAAFQKEDHSWSDSYRVELGYYDGWHLGRVVRGFRSNSNDLFAVFFWEPNTPVIVNLQNRPGLSPASTVVKDIDGNSWRISRGWNHCSRNF